jgi:predicted nucleic acid-binding protein
MILVDTSVWIDHLHNSEPRLVDLLTSSSVLGHPMVIGEIALGSIWDRRVVLDSLEGLPQITTAGHEEVLHLVESRELHGRGLSLVDAHLLASVLVHPGASLWTRDRRLEQAAVQLGRNAWTGPSGTNLPGQYG